MFSCEFCEISKSTIQHRTPLVVDSQGKERLCVRDKRYCLLAKFVAFIMIFFCLLRQWNHTPYIWICFVKIRWKSCHIMVSYHNKSNLIWQEVIYCTFNFSKVIKKLLERTVWYLIGFEVSASKLTGNLFFIYKISWVTWVSSLP